MTEVSAAPATQLDSFLGMEEVNRWLAARVSALGTAHRPASCGADPLVGARMPDLELTTAAPQPVRVYRTASPGPVSSTSVSRPARASVRPAALS